MSKTNNTTPVQEENQELSYKDLYLRALADYQNLQRRTLEDKRVMAKRVRDELLQKFIPLYHDSKQGLKYKEKGAKLLYNKFVKILQDLNISVIDSDFFVKTCESKFTEDYAVAISTVPSDKTLFNEYNQNNSGKIAAVLEDGFYDNESKTVISYAKVVVYEN